MNERGSTGPEWRSRVLAQDAGEAYQDEGREWLPTILGGLFIAAVLAAAAYLYFDTGQEDELSPEQARIIAEQEAQLPAPRSTSEERSRWEAALDADTVLAYRRFMEDFPESIYLGQAQVQLEVLDERAWQSLSSEDSEPAYRDYLEQFPDGIHQAQAMLRLDELSQAREQAERDWLLKEPEADERRVNPHEAITA